MSRRSRRKRTESPPRSSSDAGPAGGLQGLAATRWRKRLLLAVTLLLPLVFLALIELGLRLSGIGRLEPLFVPVAAAPGYLQPNERVMDRFFPDPARAVDVSIDTTYFRADKAPNGFRVFIMGESSAAGFPYGRWGSPAGFLQQRLERSLPDREVEVVSTALSAVTSYVLLDFVDEVLAHAPDAVVIYTGHNEYLGIGGVGSSYVSASSPSLARLTATLRRLHLYRTLENFTGRLTGGFGEARRRDGTLMARVARERSIPLGSALYRQGLAQFRGNMERILARFRAAGIPVLLGTLASNERDQTPFLSLLDENVDAEDWQRGMDAADALIAGGSTADAEATLRNLIATDEGAADAWFELGRALELQSLYSEARAAYLAAKDRDALRFRAPEDFNRLLRELAVQEQGQLVDTQLALAERSPHRIIGASLMLEHLHPNVEGYFRLSAALYRPLLALAGSGQYIDDETAWRERPVTEIDRLGGEYRIEILTNDWPFLPEKRAVSMPPPSNDIERIAQDWFYRKLSWADAMQRALAVYQQEGAVDDAARVAGTLALAFVHLSSPQIAAARLLLANDEPARALPFLRRAASLEPRNIDVGLLFAQAQYQSGDAAGSARTLQSLIAVAPDDKRAQRWLKVVRESGR